MGGGAEEGAYGVGDAHGRHIALWHLASAPICCRGEGRMYGVGMEVGVSHKLPR